MPLAGMYVGASECAVVGGLGLGLVAVSGQNAKVINLMLMLSQMLCVKGDSNNDESDPWMTSWMINLILVWALVGVISAVMAVRAWWLRPTRRGRGVQTDAEPVVVVGPPAAAGPAAGPAEEFMPKIFMSTKEDPRKKFHVTRECRGLQSAHHVGAYDACKVCAVKAD